MRVVFAGTPEVALPALAAVAGPPHDLVGVVTRPDAPAGRGRRLAPSPVAEAADALGVPVLKPGHPREPEFQAASARGSPRMPARSWPTAPCCRSPRSTSHPAAGSTCTFRCCPPGGVRHRCSTRSGPGDDVTGATTFRIVQELDAGPTYGLMTETVRPDDTAGDLLDRLAEGGAGLLVATLDGLADGSLEERPQSGDDVSYAPKITVDDARVDWSQPAAVDRPTGARRYARAGRLDHVRRPAPQARPARPAEGSLPPGELMAGKSAVVVGTGAGALRLGDVQAVGRRPMPAPTGRAGSASPGARCSREPPGQGLRRGRDLPVSAEVELGMSWGDPPRTSSRQKPKPRGFVLARAPRHDAVDPADRRGVPGPAGGAHPERRGQGRPGRGRRPVLHHRPLPQLQRGPVQQSRLGELEVEELREVLTDAWSRWRRSPCAKEFLAGLDPARRPATRERARTRPEGRVRGPEGGPDQGRLHQPRPAPPARQVPPDRP